MTGQTFRRSVKTDKIFFQIELEDDSLVRFDCRDSIPGGVVLGVADIAESGDSDAAKAKQGAAAIGAMKKLFKAAIIKPHQARFWAMVNGEDPDGIIDVPQMMDIAFYLAEAYTERPTGESSANGSPRTGDGSNSTAGAAPEALTYSRSPQFEPSTSLSTGARSSVS